ncbi:MAG: D-glycero-beta-D-manno-heptose 1-phosphate adenylyltransferase [Desulfovibrio sp.]
MLESPDTYALADRIALCDSLADARVLVVGDLMLDRFVRGKVSRISPEAPIPILAIEDEAAMPGGAGNVVRNLRALDVHVSCAGVVGDDAAGRELDGLLADLTGGRARLVPEPGRRTAVKTRYVSGSHHLLRTDFETVAPVSAASEQALADAALALLPEATAVVVSDYGKGGVTPGLLATLIAEAARREIPVVVDPKGVDFTRYRGASVITPNKAELAAATRATLANDAQYARAARTLILTHGFGAICVTRSEEGLSLYPAHGPATHIRAAGREVYDVSGAGDTVAAILAAGIAVGAPLGLAAALANIGAGIVVGKVGTAVAHPDELRLAVLRQSGEDAGQKELSRERAAEMADLWRRLGLTVGFTNGCFDLLHPGHAAMLDGARRECDRLIVGLNSDASVRRLKGPTRPVQDEAARARMLASLASVDAVVIFDEDTPLELIKAVRPDMLAKGGDYTLETVVGADVVTGYGGRVVLVPLTPDRSTTGLIRRISDSSRSAPG